MCKAPSSEVSGSAEAASCPTLLYLGLDEWPGGCRWVLCTVWLPSPCPEGTNKKDSPYAPSAPSPLSLLAA